MINLGNARYVKCNWFQLKKIANIADMESNVDKPEKEGETHKLKKGTITTYTCPMHPEVKQDKPGSCPKCGMDLLPEKANATDEEEIAYHRMVKKFRLALILAIPVFILGM